MYNFRNHLYSFHKTFELRKRFICIFVVALAFLNCTSSFAEDEQHSVLVITNGTSQMNSISVSNLRSIFAMRSRHWSKDVSVEVFVLPDDHPTHISFAKSILRTFPYNLRRIWDRRVYSGTGQLPNVVQSEEEMLEKINSTPNAIGYITKDYYQDSAKVVELKQ